MKIGFLIHNLNSGGAERQMVLLAKGVKALGHEVAVCIYSPGRFFETELHQAGIPLIELSPSGYWQKFSLVYGWLRKWNPHILQAFLPGPNVLAELTTLLPHSWKVVVSERSAVSPLDWKSKFYSYLHRRADWISTNSYANMSLLVREVPSLKDKSTVVWNMVDLECFSPAVPKQRRSDNRVVQFLCVASILRYKNGVRLLEALHLLRTRNVHSFHVRWIGGSKLEDKQQRPVIHEMRGLIKKYQLKNHFTFVGEKKDMVPEYNHADVLVLVSLIEGMPNVVCEAMACQLPVVLSDVADNAKILEESGSGFLCSPHDTESIADALERMIHLSEEERRAMGESARKTAENRFNPQHFIHQYEQLYQRLVDGV